MRNRSIALAGDWFGGNLNVTPIGRVRSVEVGAGGKATTRRCVCTGTGRLLSRMKDLLGDAMPRVTIAITAQAGEQDRRRTLAAGVQRHIAKPFDPLALVELLQELVVGSAV